MFDFKVKTLLKLQYVVVGIFVKRSRILENFVAVLLNCLFTIVVLSLIKNYWHLDSFLYKMDNTVYVIATLFVAFAFWISRFHKTLMLKILRTISDDERDEEFAQQIRYFLKPLLWNVTSWHTLALCLIMVLPLFTAVCTDAELGSTPTLLFPSWFPWNIHSTERYILTILLQLVSGSLLYLIAFAQEITVVCYMAVIRAHIAFFSKKVQELEDNKVWKYSGARAEKEVDVDEKILMLYSNCSYETRFREVLALFLRIHRFVKDVVACSNPFSSNSLFIFFDCSVLLSAMFVQKGKQNDILYRLKMVSGEFLGCTMFAVFCYLGDIIKRMNGEFRDILYNSSWYDRSPRVRKQILIFMQLTHLPIQMNAFQMYTIEIIFFSKIIRLCFSLLQLLMRLQSKSVSRLLTGP